MKATDWEATNEEIMELIARESYLQWLKDNEKRNTKHSLNLSNNEPNQLPGIATCSTWDQNSAPSREVCILRICIWEVFSNINYLMYFPLYFLNFWKKHLYLYLNFLFEKKKITNTNIFYLKKLSLYEVWMLLKSVRKAYIFFDYLIKKLFFFEAIKHRKRGNRAN